jgi:hypothetical protein
MNPDLHQLKLFAIFHFILAALLLLAALFFAGSLYVASSLMYHAELNELYEEMGEAAAQPYRNISNFVAIVGLIGFLLTSVATVMSLLTARFLTRQRHHRFCAITTGLQCLLVPLGTILGVFTILLLMRPEVRECFDVP